MDLGAAGLSEQPFPTHGKPLAVVTYESQREALDMLRETHEHPTGLSLLQGPSLSGKSILIRSFVESLDDDCAVAIVDGKGLNTTRLLLGVLRQFGYDIDLSSANELIGLLRVFALQQASSNQPPLLIVEHAHELNPSALRALCELAELRVRHVSAIKMVLVSDRSLAAVMNAPAMKPVAKRLLHDFHLRPMSRDEACDYIHEKLVAAGSEYPDLVFSRDVCEELWEASGGWPGVIDRIALLALASTDCLPVPADNIEHPALPSGTWDAASLPKTAPNDQIAKEPAQLVVTNNGSVIDEVLMV
jgi:general secretion pathway protein A